MIIYASLGVVFAIVLAAVAFCDAKAKALPLWVKILYVILIFVLWPIALILTASDLVNEFM